MHDIDQGHEAKLASTAQQPADRELRSALADRS